jgi:TetR/AcrR family tetracycline transcriptional repressor
MSRPAPDENREQRRADIVQAGLGVLEKEGFDKLSLRAIAREMGVHAPGLYWYITSKQELIDLLAKAILDEGLAALRPPAPGERWQDWLTELALRMRRCLVSRRDGARVVAGAYMFQTNAITPTIELALAVLEDAGFTQRQAMLGMITVMRYTMGIALDEQASPPIPPAVFHDGRVGPQGGPPIDPARFPRVAGAFGEYFTEMMADLADRGDRHFVRGVELIICGLEYCARQR